MCAGCGAGPSALRASALAFVCAPAGCCAPAWSGGGRAGLLDVSFGCNLCVVTGCLQPAPVGRLPVLAGVQPAGLRGRAVGLALGRRAVDLGRLLRYAVAGGGGGGGDLLSIALPS